MGNIFQSAIDNWPEDEAKNIIESFNSCRLDDPEYANLNLRKDIDHFAKVFSFESDGADLNRRFIKVLTEAGII